MKLDFLQPEESLPGGAAPPINPVSIDVEADGEGPELDICRHVDRFKVSKSLGFVSQTLCY